MTYATGSAATIANVMDAMSAFAQANAGMTESVRRAETLHNRLGVNETMTVICLTKGSSNWWFAYGPTDCTGFLADTDGGSVYGATGGTQAPNLSRLWPVASPFTSYHLFTEGSVVHVAFEMSSGAWAHLSFGDVTKYGTWTGGSFLSVTDAADSGIDATSATFLNNAQLTGFNALFGSITTNSGQSTTSSKMRISKGSRLYGNFCANTNISINDSVTTPVCALAMTSGVFDELTRDQPNIFNNRAMGPRLELFVSDTSVIFSGGTNLWLPIGFIPNIRFINIALLNPKDLINTDWMVFPLQAKVGLLNTYAGTLNYGIAVRK